LTAGIAHDFNNLLTAVLGNLEMLAKGPERDPVRSARLIAGARSAAERGAKLTAQLLAFSRQQQIAAAPADLNRIIQGMVPLLQSTIGGSIGIEVSPADDLWVALADPTQMELAILNLAINARDAMPLGGTICISTRNVTRGDPVRPEEPAAGDYVAVSVADTGTGMTDTVRDRVFEPFFTTKEIGKGSGLGLSQVLGVIKQLGGGLAVRTVIGQGTCVSVLLPRAGSGRLPEREPATGGGGVSALKNRHAGILLVDDDADVRMIAGDMLRDAGYVVTEAVSGQAALDALRDADMVADLMIVDLAMPGMHGVDLAQAAAALRPSMPVLFMTGYADARLLPASGGHQVLTKPFRSHELEAKVASLIARQGG
jgi:CheY-like chemotaxis protein